MSDATSRENAAVRCLLRILGWLGLGLSTILLIATVVFWVRSLGYFEEWRFDQFEPRPEWHGGEYIWRRYHVQAWHRRLCLTVLKRAPESKFNSRAEYQRKAISKDETEQRFAFLLQSGQRQWRGGTERVWTIAGAGFRHQRSSVDRQIGRPGMEVYVLVLPFEMLAVVFGLWPGLFAVRRILRRKRHVKGLCPECGYDLCATPHRCPECGRVTETKERS